MEKFQTELEHSASASAAYQPAASPHYSLHIMSHDVVVCGLVQQQQTLVNALMGYLQQQPMLWRHVPP
jgi:hypothetical protein